MTVDEFVASHGLYVSSEPIPQDSDSPDNKPGLDDLAGGGVTCLLPSYENIMDMEETVIDGKTDHVQIGESQSLAEAKRKLSVKETAKGQKKEKK